MLSALLLLTLSLTRSSCSVCGYADLDMGHVVSSQELDRAIDHAKVVVGIRLPRREELALHKLAMRESSMNRVARNKQGSSAQGLFQLLRRTRQDTNTPSLAVNRCVGCQTIGALRYIKYRYTMPSRAWSYWVKKRRY